MPELSALRARLKDRQVKEGALGTTEASICLNLALLSELSDLEDERSKIIAGTLPRGDIRSLAGAAHVQPDTTSIDAEIEAKKAEISAATLQLVFRAVSSVRYQEIVNRFEDPDKSDSQAFLDILVAECYLETWCDGEKVALDWDEIRPETSFGEYDEICSQVFNLNRRRQDVPFSLKPSKPTPKRGGTPKPV